MRLSGTFPFGLTWTQVRDSLWFLPSIAVVLASTLAVVAVRLPTPRTGSGLAQTWLFSGGAEGARGVLAAIAGGLITVTGTVFSVTIVALQLASSQFTPRVLGSFMADRVNQTVLGVFIGTFTYTLLVLRTIHSEGPDRTVFVPHVAITIALLLLLVSIGALIVYINHAAQSIRVSVILHRETQRTLARVEQLFPDRTGRSASTGQRSPVAWDPSDASTVVRAVESGYLQVVHADTLWQLAKKTGRHPITLRMELHVGAFVFPGKVLATVWPAQLEGDVADAVRRAFVLGRERTLEHDAEFGLVEISDIALKALSPGINDPTTAIHCIDRLTEILAALGTRRHPDPVRTSTDGAIRLIVRDTSFERAAGLAFDQIRHFGADNPRIVKRLLEAITDLAGTVVVEARPALHAQAYAVLEAARHAITSTSELAAIEHVAVSALAAQMSEP